MKSYLARFFLVVSFIFLNGYCAMVMAQSSKTTQQYIEYLKQQQQNLKIGLTKFDKELDLETDLNDAIKSADLLLQINNNRLTRLSQSLKSYQDVAIKLDTRQKKLMSLQVNPEYKQGDLLEQQIEKINYVNQLNRRAIALLQQNIKLARQYSQLIENYRNTIKIKKLKVITDEKLQLYQKRQQQIAESISQLIANGISMQKDNIGADIKNTIGNEVNILLNNQKIKYLQLTNDVVEIEKHFIRDELQVTAAKSNEQLSKINDDYQQLASKADEIKIEINHSIQLLKQQLNIFKGSDIAVKRELTKIIELKRDYEALEKQINLTSQEILQRSNKLTQYFNKQKKIRPEWVSGHLLSAQLMNDFVKLPQQFYRHLALLMSQLSQQIEQMTQMEVIAYIAVTLILVTLFAFIGYWIRNIEKFSHEYRVSAQLLNSIVYVLNANLWIMLIGLLFFTLFRFSELPYENYQLVANLYWIIFGFRLITSLARVILYERLSDVSGSDVKLYRQLRASLIFAAVIISLMTVAHQLLLSASLQQFLNWMFMLFLLALAIILLRSRELIPGLLRPLIRSSKRYVKQFIRLLSLLIPVSLLINALTGLIGFIDFAWLMGYYQSVFILLLTLYVIARGVLFDLLEILSEGMIKRLSNGWLLSEVFLKPLHLVLRMLLFFCFIVLLALCYGWTTNELFADIIKNFLSFTLVNISGIHITVLSTIEFVILLSVFVWAAKWSREFCYRWVFKSIRDPGIKNSLSVFSQYTLVVIGTIVTLRVLGIEFSGMSYVLGGLAVGMGFGLRDFASNIIGGLMLLIERPVREGDLVTLGSYEGRVAHIGIRSMRVRSWDNMEVLIPNAETFNKPFTNWTHQDSIVRTVVPIKVQASEDPVRVHQLILDVLMIMPEVLTDPEPQVFLNQIDDALISFEVRYFINIETISRFESRSKVLFAITAQFKASGIKPPIPPIQINHDETS